MKSLLPILILLLLSAPFMKAQDTIVKRNNETIIAKILEVNPDNVKYKRFDYLDGPVFTSDKWELKSITYHNGVTENYINYVPPITKIHDTIKSNVVKSNLLIQPSGKNYYYLGLKIAEPDMLMVAQKLNDKKINMMIEKTNQDRIVEKSALYGGMVVGFVGLLTYVGVITAFDPTVNSVSYGGRSSRGARSAATTQRHTTAGYIMLGGIACELTSVVFKVQRVRHAHMVVDAYNKHIQP